MRGLVFKVCKGLVGVLKRGSGSEGASLFESVQKSISTFAVAMVFV